jgi:hypothetical protein
VTIRVKSAVGASLLLACLGAASPAQANVITDWDEKAVDVVSTMPPHDAQRAMAMVHAAMFDAVNAIEHRYRPYLTQLSATPDTSKEASAAAAAAAILTTIGPAAADRTRAALNSYLATLPDDVARSKGIKLGESVAAAVITARANDGADAPDDYRPQTRPGVYVPTSLTAGAVWPRMKPFTIASAQQFRPQPPLSLLSNEWATDFNEIKAVGSRTSNSRSAQQTETARLWLTRGPQLYHPVLRQIAVARQMTVSESARFMALGAFALTDALIAVFDAKYHYNFWRPITAIRNADNDGNVATDREATWRPLDDTPLHPEYPCAHCIQSGALAGVVKTVLGTSEIPEVSVSGPTAPGVVHRFTDITTLAEEAANGRVWAGFHYRFSTRVGSEMGRKIGEYVVKNTMQSQD